MKEKQLNFQNIICLCSGGQYRGQGNGSCPAHGTFADHSTPPVTLHGLSRLGVPEMAGQMVLLSYRYLHVFSHEARRMTMTIPAMMPSPMTIPMNEVILIVFISTSREDILTFPEQAKRKAGVDVTLTRAA